MYSNPFKKNVFKIGIFLYNMYVDNLEGLYAYDNFTTIKMVQPINYFKNILKHF